MAANTIPIYVDSYKTAGVRINTANANLDGTGTIATIFTAGADGALLYLINAKAEVTTTAGMLRFFLLKSGTYYIVEEMIVPAITKSATVPSFWQQSSYMLKLEAGDAFCVSTEKAEMFSITAYYGEY